MAIASTDGKTETVIQYIFKVVDNMSKKNTKSERLNIRIEPNIKEKLITYTDETGRTISWLVTKLIKEELERHYKNRQ